MNTSKVERHVVLVAPEIHWNTGNIGRTCLGAGAVLHLIRPLGFSLSNAAVKRAGLDYWPQVNPYIWNDFNSFSKAFKPSPGETALFSKTGSRPFWNMPRGSRLFLIFGSETNGLPDNVLAAFPRQTFHIPILKTIRSLNLSTAAGIALYESLRRIGPPHDWK
jgi:tRNA (cytidine/uridine-2'-O-)-methyltransferase